MAQKNSHATPDQDAVSELGPVIAIRLGRWRAFSLGSTATAVDDGPLSANLMASLCNVPLFVPGTLCEVALATMGLVLGSQITPELASRIAQWLISLLLLLANVIVSTYGVMCWYRRCGFQPAEVLFSALPGSMAAMVAIANKLNIDPRALR